MREIETRKCPNCGAEMVNEVMEWRCPKCEYTECIEPEYCPIKREEKK